MHRSAPHFKCLRPHIRAYKILDLHLRELPETKDKVTRRYLITKSFADLRDAEWELGMLGINYILKVRKNPASRLGPQVHHGALVLRSARMGLKHHIELPRLAEAARTIWAF